jgi:molybdopterin molybdotransferase
MPVSLEAARARVLAACQPLSTERVPIEDALGRTLAEPLVALTDLPPFDNSAMDGYAVTAGPPGRTLRLVGESLAGTPATTPLDRTTAIRISTGAALPPLTDAVVPQELTRVADGFVELHVDATPGLNIRLAGEDISAGRQVLAPGTRIRPVDLAVAIGTGHDQLACHRRPRVVILGTGNELRPPGRPLHPGQIHDSNTTTIAALVTQAGALVVTRDRVPDDPGATRAALLAAFQRADLLILTGGVSVGPQDHVRAALAGLDTDEHFSGVQVRPGRPAWFGVRSGVPVFALPGNPVAAIAIFLALVRPALAALSGCQPPPGPELVALADRVGPSPGRTTIVGLTIREAIDRPSDALASSPLSAHATGPLLAFDALGLIPPSEHSLPAGTPIEVLRLSRER